MVVLVVDDQTYVVSGIVSGVNWERIHVSKVLKAYNAQEARAILNNQAVDIMLCDIEMPAEDGLSLFKWVKNNRINTECIFLTAHADFVYAKEALKLGGFDYIVQPARYEDIEDAILRAIDKIADTKKETELASLGQIFYEKKDKMLNNILSDLYFSEETDIDSIIEDLRKLGVFIKKESYLFIVMASIFVRGTMSSIQFRETLLCTANKVFDGCGQKFLFSEHNNGKYFFLLYSESNLLIDYKELTRLLEVLTKTMRDGYGCVMAFYTGSMLMLQDIPSRINKLKKMDEDNVALAGKTFCLEQSKESVRDSGIKHLFIKWASMMLNDAGQAVHEEICSYLEKIASAEQLNAESLRRFYQNFIQMIYSVAEQKNISIQHIFHDKKVLDWSIYAHMTLSKMLDFVNYIMVFFYKPNTEAEDRDQVARIIKYIMSKIDEDIRREDIAKEVFLNPDYLSRIFKREVGVSLKEFITQTKMRQAKKLLQTTTMQISMVAIKVGYTNFSHFSQIYKRTMGVSPMEERARDRRDTSYGVQNTM